MEHPTCEVGHHGPGLGRVCIKKPAALSHVKRETRSGTITHTDTPTSTLPKKAQPTHPEQTPTETWTLTLTFTPRLTHPRPQR